MSSAISIPQTEGDEVLNRLAATSRAQGLDQLAGQLDDLSDWLGADLGAIEAELGAFERSDLAGRAAVHLLERPGKRIRALSLLFASRFGGRIKVEAARELAIAAELVHAATLLHDDVIDEGTERRGAPSARMVYGNSASILGGDHLLIEALRRVQRSGNAALLTELLDVIGEMIAAEAVQLEQRTAKIPQNEAQRRDRKALYVKVARGKTAALFRWSLRAGGVLAGLDDRAVHALGEAGEALGMAFQLIDDALDLSGDSASIGKDVLADLREGKITWPLLAALDRDPEMVPDLDRADLALIAKRIRAAGGVEATRAEAKKHGDKALNALATVPDSRARRAFEALVGAALARTR